MSAPPRLFVTDPLAADGHARFSVGQAHYLAHVMRLKPGDAALVFNGRDGEWRVRLTALDKRGGAGACEAQTRPQDATPAIGLVFAPVKGDRVDSIAEKATELGAAWLQPVTTQRTVVRRVNEARLAARCVEAAEQTGRLSVPPVRPARTLDALLAGWDRDVALVFADEAGDGPDGFWGGPAGRAPPIGAALAGRAGGGVALLVGPEGGFTAQERARVRALPFAIPVTLGPRILRADTAAFAGLALLQTFVGDWR